MSQRQLSSLYKFINSSPFLILCLFAAIYKNFRKQRDQKNNLADEVKPGSAGHVIKNNRFAGRKKNTIEKVGRKFFDFIEHSAIGK